MPFSSGTLHVPQALVDLCVAYTPDEDDYIRNLFFPRKPVQHDTDKIRVIDKAEQLRLYDLDMAPNAVAPSIEYRVGANLTYQCQPYSGRAPVNSYEIANADAALQHELRQTRKVLTAMGIRMEYAALQTLRDTSVMTSNETLSVGAGNRWDNFGSSSSTPIEDLQASVSQVRIKTGRSRKKGRIKVAMHEFVWMSLMQHPNVIQRAIFTGGPGAQLTEAILAGWLGIQAADIVVTAAQYTSSAQGAATTTYSSFIGPDVIVAFVDDGGLDDYCLGHEFVFNAMGGDEPFFIRKYRVEQEGIAGLDYVQVATSAQYKATNAAEAGFLIKSVLDTTNTARYAGLL